MPTRSLSRFLGSRLLFGLLAISLAAPAAASGQMLYATGGDMLRADAETSSGAEHLAGFQAGSRFWLTDLFQVQAAVTYQDVFAAEGALLLRPLAGSRRLDPYAFVGYGGFFDGDGSRSVVPLGVGVEYLLNESLGVLFELTGRWTLDDEHVSYEEELEFGLMPSVGFSYRLRGGQRPVMGREPYFGEAESDGVEGEVVAGAGRSAPDRTGRLAEARPPAGTATPAEAAATLGEARPRAAGAVDRRPASASTLAEGRTPTAARAIDTVPPRASLDLQLPRERVFLMTAASDTDTVALDMNETMVRVPDGTFILGLTDEDPLQLQTAGLRRITLSGYFIDRYEVSNAQYRAFLGEVATNRVPDLRPDTTMGQVGNRFSWGEYFRGVAFDDHPVVGVTYGQAEEYCAFYGKRLPTEAEWEYAARSGYIGGVYPWPGLEPRDEVGNFMANYNPGRGGYAADGYAFTAPVDAFPATRWNLHNMSGNVAEWCQDTFHPSYSTLSDFNPAHIDPEEDRRVVRGGSWASDAFYIGVGVRDAMPAGEASPYVGFRCVMDVSAVGN